jgi:hypothetical protein
MKKKSLSTSVMSQIIYFQSNSFYLANENSIHISMENLIQLLKKTKHNNVKNKIKINSSIE